MKYKYCLIRQADYSRNGRCELPLYAENTYFYTLNDLKVYIADELYVYTHTQVSEVCKNKFYDKLRNFAKYIVLSSEYVKPTNKISYHQLYEDTYTYTSNDGVQQDEMFILGKIRVRDISWNPFNLCELDWNALEKELIPYVERVIYDIVYGTFDKKLQIHYIYPYVKTKVVCTPMWSAPKTYISHQYRGYGNAKHQYITEKALLQDPETYVYTKSRQRLRSKDYYSGGAGKYSLGWKAQYKCRKAWAKHKKTVQYVNPTKAVYDVYMQDWICDD